MPKVSVVIPTHNRPDLVLRAISSVLKQTFQDFEIIVVDDGFEKRADNAIKIVEDSRIYYIQNSKPLGGGGSRNVGIKNARGQYIAFLDDDDEWSEKKIKMQVDAFEESNEFVSVVFTGVEMRDKDGTPFRTVLPNEAGIVTPYERLLRRPYIWTSAMMMRTSCRDNEGHFDENLTKNQEWDLTVRLSKETPFFAIDESLTYLNVLGEDEHMGGKGNIINIIKGNELFLEKHIDEYIIRPSSYAAQLFRLAGFYYENYQFNLVQDNLYKAWKLQYFNMIYFRHFLVSLLGKKVYSFFRK